MSAPSPSVGTSDPVEPMADVAAAASAQKRKFEEETTEAPAASEQASSKRPRSDEAIVSAGECAQVDANQMHARNIYRKAPPDFLALAEAHSEFRPFVSVRGVHTGRSFGVIDWSDPRALLAVTRVLLKHDFRLEFDMPLNHLCPPIPQRLNYVHWVADLLGIHSAADARNTEVRGLDIGTGASCIFPLLAHGTYGWRFLATEIDPESVAAAQANVSRNRLDAHIAIRSVASASRLLSDVLLPADGAFAFSMCNPPFFSSLAQTGLNASRSGAATPGELVCEGGEEAFVARMIRESKAHAGRIRWCTTMLGRKSSIKPLVALLHSPAIAALVVDQTEFLQGQQARYGLAWSFCEEEREKRAATLRQEKAQQSSNGANFHPDHRPITVASSPSVHQSSTPVVPRQRIKFSFPIAAGTPTADVASVMHHLRETILAHTAGAQGLPPPAIVEVNSQQWRVTTGRQTADAAAPPLFSADLLLMQPTAKEWMVDLSWRKPAPVKGAPSAEESKIAFTRLGLALEESCTSARAKPK